MNLSQRIEAFVKLGFVIETSLKDIENGMYDSNESYNIDIAKRILEANHENGWFIEFFSMHALSQISKMLSRESLIHWLSVYNLGLLDNNKAKNVSIIMAGNLPFVGFQDFLAVLIIGHKLKAKFSSKDSVLPKMIVDLLCAIEPLFVPYIEVVDSPLRDYDAVIATGSDNSNRYFEYYFKDIPSIIRGNRNSVAIILGDETEEQLMGLTHDIFMYFGLGCRSVSKLYLPTHYKVEKLFPYFEKYQAILYNHHKYMNNYLYQKSILLVNKIPFFDNGFAMLTEGEPISSPISVIHFQYYDSIDIVMDELVRKEHKIQCVVANSCVSRNVIDFGDAQKPSLLDYADGVDVVDFLQTLKK